MYLNMFDYVLGMPLHLPLPTTLSLLSALCVVEGIWQLVKFSIQPILLRNASFYNDGTRNLNEKVTWYRHRYIFIVKLEFDEG